MTIHSGPGPTGVCHLCASLCSRSDSGAQVTATSSPPSWEHSSSQDEPSVSIPVLGFGFDFDFSSFAVADVENLSSSSSVAVAQHLAVCVVV